MAFTPEEQSDFEYLKGKYVTPFQDVPQAESEPRPGLFSRTVRNIGNVPSIALEGLMGVGTGIANLFEPADDKTAHAQIPRIFDLPAAQSAGEHMADLPGNLIGVLPQFLVPGGIAAKAAGALGAGAAATNVIAQTVGGAVGGLGFSPTSAVTQGGVGALQGFAETLPRQARGILALGAGAVGAGEAMLNGGSVKDALTMGALNTAATFASPQVSDAVRKTLARNAAGIAEDQAAKVRPPTAAPVPVSPAETGIVDIGGGRPIVGRPVRPGEVLDESQQYQQQAIRTNPGLFAGDTGLARLQEPTAPPQANLTQLPEGLIDLGQTPRQVQAPMIEPRPGLVDFGSQPQPRGNLIDLGNQPQARRPLVNELPVDASGYGRGVDPYDAAAGLPRRSEGANNGMQPAAVAEPVATLQVPHPQSKLPSGLQKLLANDPAWTPEGQQLGPSFTGAAFKFGSTFKTAKDVERAYKGAAAFEKEGMRLLNLDDLSMDDMTRAQELVSKAQYLKEAAEYAEGLPSKVETYRKYNDPNYQPAVPGKAYLESPHAKPPAAAAPAAELTPHDVVPAIRVGEKLIEGRKGDTHKDILNRYMDEHPDDVDALMNFDTKENPNRFIAQGQELSREDLKAKFGVVDSQGLARLQTEQPINPTKPVEPAAPTVRKVEAVAFKLADGTVVKGAPGETHFQAVSRVPEGSEMADGFQDGFIDNAGNFLTRDQAANLTQQEGRVTSEKIAALQSPTIVRVQGKYGWEDAKVLGHEGDTLHIEVDDPIFGPRRASVLKSDTREVVAPVPIPESAREVPFADLPGARTQLDHANEKFGGEAGLLGSQLEGAGPETLPGNVRKTLPGRARTNLSVVQGLAKLPAEAGQLIGEIFARMQTAINHSIDLSLAQRMPGMKGGAYDKSGKVVLNLQWINLVVRNWEKMTPETQGKALMRVSALFGHEITHVSQKFGERSGLAINGKPLLTAITDEVAALNPSQREFIAKQIKEAKGEPGEVVSKYLAGDINAVYGAYKAMRPNLTREQAVELAAGEFMAEIGAIELIKRTKVDGLPVGFRAIVDKFKEVLVRTVNWFRGNKDASGVAALQNLQDIAAKMHDNFAAADTHALHKAFPASTEWRPPPVAKTAPIPIPHVPSVAVAPYAKNELAKLGVRAAIGGAIGGTVGPAATDRHATFAESVIAGGIMGVFGPAMMKSVLSGTIAKEIATVKAEKGTIAAFKSLMRGKTLTELGREGRYGWRGDGSTLAKVVRFMESDFNLNFDPKLKAAIEQGRGIAAEQFALIEDALKKARWMQPSQTVKDLTDKFIDGAIDKTEYLAGLQDDASRTYGNFMVSMREGTSVLSDMFAGGLRQSKFRDFVIGNREKYVKRAYTAYRDGEFDMAHFEAVKKDLMSLNPGMDIHNADALLREHMIEIKANRRLFGSKRGTGAQSLDTTLNYKRRATEEEIEMQQMRVAEHEHDPFGAEYQREKAKLDWMETHKITDNWRAWLGEIKDPTERMVYTFQKLYPSAIAGKIYDLLDNSSNSLGNKFAYTAHELTSTRQLIQSELRKNLPPEEIATLQNRLAELETYSPLPEGAAYGKLSGKFTDRFTRDHISTYDTPYKWMEQPVLRGIAAINSVVKVNRTVLNPLTVVRNYMQMPLFMLIGRVGLRDVHDAARILHRGADPETLSIMRQRHILGVDYAASELSTNLGTLVSGHFDSDAAVRIAKQGYNKAREIYQQPDTLVRAGAFLSARARIAERMELPLNHPQVIDAAVEAADRLTMNYATVPRVVKAARQLPFVSLFVSYTSEITKIIKNLATDAISPTAHQSDRLHAIGVLGAMAAIPPMLVQAFESNLSERDLRDWKKLRSLQPDYARPRFLLPTHRDNQGRFHYMDVTTMIPADNYTQMIAASLSGDMKAAASANPFFSLQDTPLLNIATEQISGQSLRTHDKISGVNRIREVLQEVLPPVIPPGYEGQRLTRAFSENNQGDLGITNLRSGAITRPSDIVASYLTGMRFGNVELATVQRQAISEAKQAIAEQQTQLRQVTNTNAAEADQMAARQHYRQTVEQIMLQLHSRISDK